VSDEVGEPGLRRWADDEPPKAGQEGPESGAADGDERSPATTELEQELRSIRAVGEDRR
jgi:hypothetical protein